MSTAAKADLSEARRLLGAGMQLVRMVPMTKRPAGDDWNHKPVESIDDDATGYGLILATNKLCSIDPDHLAHARIGMRALGFELDQLLDAGVRTKSTRPGSGGRSTFAAEGDLAWLTFASKDTGTVIEFRADSPNLQDTIPGIVYRDKGGRLCRQAYANGKRLDDAPQLPDELYTWWSRCATDVEFYREQQAKFFAALEVQPSLAISSGKGQALAYAAPGLRSRFNSRHDVEAILDRHGYTWHRDVDRWAPPTASGAPGVRPIPGRTGLWRSDHASDPLHGTFDAWTAFVVLDHAGDLEAAVRAAELEDAPPPMELPPVEVYVAEHDESQHPAAEPPRGIVLRSLGEVIAERREPRWLIHRVLEQGVLAVLAGPRSTLKSFIGLHWHLKIAAAGHQAVILSAEGAGLDRRADAWMRVHGRGLDPNTMPVRILERPINLNLDAELEALVAAIGGIPPASILIDTFSKYSAGLDENSNTEVALFLNRLAVRLRDYYGCTVLLVAHSGHGEGARPRGASVLMANPDAEYIVKRVSPLTPFVNVSRERFKDSPAMESLGYEAKVIDLGRTDRYGDPVTSLALVPTDPQPDEESKPVLKGKAQRQLLAALRAHRSGSGGPGIWTIAEIREVGRLAGMHRNTARDAAEALALSPFMTPTVGGYKLKDE